VTDTSNTTSNTIRFTNATTGLVTTGNVEVGSNISVTGLADPINKYLPMVGTDGFFEKSPIYFTSGGTYVVSAAEAEFLGNLTLSGNTTILNSESVTISDRIFGIGANNAVHNLDTGIMMEHKDDGEYANVALIYHAEDHRFAISYTQNTFTDEHILDYEDPNHVMQIDLIGNVEVQHNLVVNETTTLTGDLSVVGTTKLQDSVGIANTAPIHDLDVGSNLYVDDQGSNVLHVTGNVYATRFVGDGAFLENIASNLHEITTNGNVTTNTVQFDGSTALVTTGGVGIANTAPIHDLDVGSNLYVDDQSSNVLHVTGNVYATRFVGDGAFLENIASNLHEITTNGNVTTNTVHFDGSTALVTTGNVGIANAAPGHELSVTGNVYVSSEVNVVGGLVTNLGGLTKKTYGYSAGTITASTTPEINVVFDSQLFSAKITAHLVEPTSNISVLNLDVTGGTGRNIGKGFLSIVGDQNSKHWNSTIDTTNTTVTLTPSVGLLSDGTYGVHVEYTSPLGTGGVTSIDKNNTNEITFDY